MSSDAGNILQSNDPAPRVSALMKTTSKIGQTALF